MNTFPIGFEAVVAQADDPLHLQIRRQIEQAIDQGRLARGQLLPAERELAETFGVNRMTLRQALNHLESAGIVTRRQGVGTFVSDRIRLDDVLSFSDKVRSEGHVPGSRLLNAEIVPAIPAVNAILGLTSDDELVHIRRMRSVDNIPVQVGSGYLSARRFPDLPSLLRGLGHGSFYQFLKDECGVIVHQVQETLEAAVVGDAEAEILECSAGAPAFLRELIAIDPRGNPIEYGHTLARGDRCTYSFTLTQRQGATGALALHFDTSATPDTRRFAQSL